MTVRAQSIAKRLATEVLSGSARALSRSLTIAERGGETADELLELLYPHTGRAYIVGITGIPGSGKSTLASGLARVATERGFSVGIIAIDPSSPYSGGSILGDRIRMNDVAVEFGVFVRSFASHGAIGGLCPAAGDCIDLMDAAGRDLIFVETVGVGQDEVDIMQIAHTVMVVSVPGLGDEIQMLKAGILEIADLHVVNKADREGADRVMAELSNMLSLGSARSNAWSPPVVSCVALEADGIRPVLDALLDRRTLVMSAAADATTGRKKIAKARVLKIAGGIVTEGIASPECQPDELIEGVVRRELSPRTCARLLLTRWAIQNRERKDDVGM